MSQQPPQAKLWRAQRLSRALCRQAVPGSDCCLQWTLCLPLRLSRELSRNGRLAELSSNEATSHALLVVQGALREPAAAATSKGHEARTYQLPMLLKTTAGQRQCGAALHFRGYRRRQRGGRAAAQRFSYQLRLTIKVRLPLQPARQHAEPWHSVQCSAVPDRIEVGSPQAERTNVL